MALNATIPAPATAPNSAAVPHRVVVVDDARTVRMYYRGILERVNIEVTEAENGLDGLEKAAEVLPDLLVVDINMPKMDGCARFGPTAACAASPPS